MDWWTHAEKILFFLSEYRRKSGLARETRMRTSYNAMHCMGSFHKYILLYIPMVTCSNFKRFNALITVDLQWSSTIWQYVIDNMVTIATVPSLGYHWDTGHLGNLSDDIIMYWITWPLLFSPTDYSSWLLSWCHHHLPSMNCDGLYSCTGYQFDQLYRVL